MRKNRAIAGLEIGSTRVSMVVGEIKNGSFNFLCASREPCLNGIKNGVVVDLDAVTEAIVKLVEGVNQKIGRRIDTSFVNISGLNIIGKIANSVTTLPRRGCEIAQRHADDLMESCKIVSVPLDRHLLYFSPLEYVIDGQDGIKNPIGLCGSKLEAKIFIATAPFNQVQNIIKSANSAGLGVEEVILTSLANSCCVLGEEERRQGVLLVDFKRDMTEIAIFKDDAMLFFKVIPKGQGHVTDEIARRLNIPFEIARDLKMRYGFFDDGQDMRIRENIPIEWMGRNQTVLRGDLNNVIKEGFGSIFDLILKAVDGFEGFNGIAKAGMVATGGCTSMEGFLDWACGKAGFLVRRGQIKSDLGILEDTYVGSCGMVNFTTEKNRDTNLNGTTGIFKKVLQRAGDILGDYF